MPRTISRKAARKKARRFANAPNAAQSPNQSTPPGQSADPIEAAQSDFEQILADWHLHHPDAARNCDLKQINAGVNSLSRLIHNRIAMGELYGDTKGVTVESVDKLIQALSSSLHLRSTRRADPLA